MSHSFNIPPWRGGPTKRPELEKHGARTGKQASSEKQEAQGTDQEICHILGVSFRNGFGPGRSGPFFIWLVRSQYQVALVEQFDHRRKVGVRKGCGKQIRFDFSAQ